MNKNYSSYQEIERDLEILSIEREIHKQKVLQSFNQTKTEVANFDAGNMLKSVLPSVTKIGQFVGRNKGLKSLLYSYLLRLAIKKIFKR
ncbi:MAG TPA: DUF6327 family protein [Flavobacterium sp.]|nr:DUF6327 family protein [Flavobacterium sp.]